MDRHVEAHLRRMSASMGALWLRLNVVDPFAAELLDEVSPDLAVAGKTALLAVDARDANVRTSAEVARAVRAGASELFVAVIVPSSESDDEDVAGRMGQEALVLGARQGLSWVQQEPMIMHLDGTLDDAGAFDSVVQLAQALRRARSTGVDIDLPDDADALLRSVYIEMVDASIEPPPDLRPALGFPARNPFRGPVFQFDLEAKRVHTLVLELRDTLRYGDDPVGAYSWWTRRNTWIGEAPAALLGTDREPLIRYAADCLTEDGW